MIFHRRFSIIFLLLLAGCNPGHIHWASLDNYEHPFGVWHGAGDFEIRIGRDIYEVCEAQSCERGDVLIESGETLLLKFNETKSGATLADGRWVELSRRVPGAVDFYVNTGKPYQKKVCFGRPCVRRGPMNGHRVHFHWHGPWKR